MSALDRLTIATVAFGLILVIKGALMLLFRQRAAEATIKLLYHRPSAIILWLVGVGWTLVEITRLGPADFGSFRPALLVLFGALGISAIWMLKDYLIVRAFSVITLYFVWRLLETTYLQPYPTAGFLTFAVYIAIIKAMYFTVAPWRARDGLQHCLAHPKLWRGIATFWTCYGVLLLAAAATYRLF